MLSFYRRFPLATRDHVQQPDLLTAFRRTVVQRIRQQIASERERAQARRARTIPRLREAVRAARDRGRCTRVWLFGSYAWGQPGDRSDVDLLVEGCTDPMELAGDISDAVGIEIHVVTQDTAAPTLVQRALKEGIAL